MNLFAAVVLLVWPAVVVFLFNSMPPKKAVAYLFVFAWLFLPNGGFVLPGVPDYTKMTATVVSLLLCAAAFDPRRLLALRFRWYDVPMVAFSLGPFVTALANGLTAYDGLSAITEQSTAWGLPYLVGRAYFDEVDDMVTLARAIVIGGLLYVPLCLFEIRISPILQVTLYGISRWEGMRYGGYRPRVFLTTGLELGIWMTNASFLGYVLWATGALKAIRSVPYGALLLGLVATSVLCKSTGAIILLAFAVGAFWFTRKSKSLVLAWALVAIPPAYCVVRALDLWSGRQVVDLTTATLGEERAESFEYRLKMERLLADRALERPILGWGGFDRFSVSDKSGKRMTIPDGYWIIVLGTQGTVGLVGLLFLFGMPLARTLRRFPASTWGDPRVGATVGVALMLTVTMIDFLSNAMLMPIYPLAIGGLLGQLPDRRPSGLGEAEEALAHAAGLAEGGHMAEAAPEFRLALEMASAGTDLDSVALQAEALDGLGQSLLARGLPEEAAEALREALALRDELAARDPDDGRFADLAIARDGLSRVLAESGRADEAVEERGQALRIWEALAANRPGDAGYRDRRVDTLNDMAWLLATDPGLAHRDPAEALALAEGAVRLAPGHDASWNTLGVARCRAGDWAGAVEALERSCQAAPGGSGTAFDHYFLAIAWARLGRDDLAGEWIERGAAWAARHRPGHPPLARFRDEAEALLAAGPDGEPPRAAPISS